jgi:hypothetical protein
MRTKDADRQVAGKSDHADEQRQDADAARVQRIPRPERFVGQERQNEREGANSAKARVPPLLALGADQEPSGHGHADRQQNLDPSRAHRAMLPHEERWATQLLRLDVKAAGRGDVRH